MANSLLFVNRVIYSHRKQTHMRERARGNASNNNLALTRSRRMTGAVAVSVCVCFVCADHVINVINVHMSRESCWWRSDMADGVNDEDHHKAFIADILFV